MDDSGLIWGVFDSGTRVDVAPVGHRHQLIGSCWCGVTIITEEDGIKYERPLVTHYAKSHDWKHDPVLDMVACRRCGKRRTGKASARVRF